MLTHLQKIVQEVNSAPSLQAVLNIAVLRVNEVIATSVCMIYLRNPEDQDYSLRASEGLGGFDKKAFSALNESLANLVGYQATPIHLDHESLSPHSLPAPEVDIHTPYAYIGVPIIHQRRVLGALLAVKKGDESYFDQDEEAFLVTLSAQLAGVMAHAEAISGGNLANQPAIEQTDAKFSGVTGSPGVAMGTAVIMYPPADLNAIPDRIVKDKARQLKVFRHAIGLVKDEIQALKADLSKNLEPEHALLFDVYFQMLNDQALIGKVEALIEQGHWAQGALKNVIRQQMEKFDQVKDDYLRERKVDIEQLGQHILFHLEKTTQYQQIFPPNTILIADNVSPAMLGKVPRHALTGIVSVSGSATSHMAILARALDVPALMGTVDLPYLDLEGFKVIIDGRQSLLYINPSDDLKTHYQKIITEAKYFSKELDENPHPISETTDHHRIHLMANINLTSDIDRALRNEAEGIGLYRTEFHFIDKEHFPTEGEQSILYQRHMVKIAPRDITIRTLDVGGDKPLSYFPFKEENPSLGWRGIRITLDHPEILTAQVRAIIRAHAGLEGKLRILLPMVSTIGEARESKALIERCYQEIIREGYKSLPPLVGAMIEVPAAAYQAETFAKYMDFLAVGSNDLTQYILAVDRNNPRVSGLYQELHPSVLKTLRNIVRDVQKTNTEISVCGELASDPFGCVLLIGMGYNVLSMNASSLAKVRWVIERISLEKAIKLVNEVLAMEMPEEVKTHMQAAFIESGLERILRAGVL